MISQRRGPRLCRGPTDALLPDVEGGLQQPQHPVVVLENTGHWVLEGRPKETTEARENFYD